MRQKFAIILGIIYLAILFTSLLVLFKSGASIFYLKLPINTQNLVQNGNLYEYQIRVDYHFFDPATLMVVEDTTILEGSYPNQLTPGSEGKYALKDIREGQLFILFSPTGSLDPATNGKVYQIYIRPFLISSNLGGFVFLVGFLFFTAFIIFNLRDSHKRQILFGSPLGFVRLWVDLFASSKSSQRNVKFEYHFPVSVWKRSAVDIILVVYSYVLMEWLFFITKPSFLDMLNMDEKIRIFLVTGLVLSALTLAVLPCLFLVGYLLSKINSPIYKYFHHLPAGFLICCLALILVDNFTYSIFKFGVISTQMLGRFFYAVCFIAFFIHTIRQISLRENISQSKGKQKISLLTATILVATSFILVGSSYTPGTNNIAFAGDAVAIQTPNIIFLSSDGLNAENMSVYGYARDTTPFLREYSKFSLRSENNFSNSGHTQGSTTAVLTGKLPMDTRVLYPPNTLKGDDTYQHLPGLLKVNGYKTVQLGIPYFVDANATNFKKAFDAVNCYDNSMDDLLNQLSNHGFDNEIYFLTSIVGRISERLAHIFFIKDMENPLTQVNRAMASSISDQERLACLRNYIDETSQSGQPFFAQVHLMGTHGDRFYPERRVFSKDQTQDDPWMTDFYDDSILEFDLIVEQLVQYLEVKGLGNNTILVIYSDHGQKYTTTDRIPLIIHFPNNQHSKVVALNTQTIDIAPTILNYMNIKKPAWMEGNSILGDLDNNRLILGNTTNKIVSVSGQFTLIEEALKSPFYQFSTLTIIQCQEIITFNLENMTKRVDQVKNYVNGCSMNDLDSKEGIREKVGQILIRLGYTLPKNW